MDPLSLLALAAGVAGPVLGYLLGRRRGHAQGHEAGRAEGYAKGMAAMEPDVEGTRPVRDEAEIVVGAHLILMDGRRVEVLEAAPPGYFWKEPAAANGFAVEVRETKGQPGTCEKRTFYLTREQAMKMRIPAALSHAEAVAALDAATKPAPTPERA